MRLTGDVEEKIEDQSADAQIKRQARKVILKGNLLGLALALITMLIP
jgi:hypothetical protein